MEKKSKKLIKQLLTTVSAVAVLSTGVNSALGARSEIDVGGATINGTGGGVNTAPAFNNGDDIKYLSAQTLTTLASVRIASIDLNNQDVAAAPFTVAHNTSLGSVVDLVGVRFLPVSIDANVELTLTGTRGAAGDENVYTSLGVLTIGNGGKLIVKLDGVDGAGDTKVIFTKGIVAANANNGVIEIAAGNTAQFNVAIGATALKKLTLVGDGSTAIFKANATFDTANGSGIEFGGDGVVSIGAAVATITGDIKNTSGADKKGSIVLTGANAQTILGNVGASGAALENITFKADEAIIAKGANFYVSELTNNADNIGKLTIGGEAVGGKVTIVTSTTATKALAQFNIDAKSGGGAKTEATITGASNIRTGAASLVAGQAHELTIIGGSTLDVRNVAGDVGAFTFNAANQKLILGSANDAKSSGTLVGNVVGAGVGVIEVGASEATIQGKIGNAAAIAGINFTKAGGVLNVDGRTGAAAAGVAAAAAGVIKAPIDFGAATDATTKLVIKNTDGNGATITGKVTIAANAAEGRGAIVMDSTLVGKTLTVDGKIGNTGAATEILNLIDVKDNDLILSGGDAHINTIKLGGNRTITLNKDGATYLIHNIDHTNNVGKLKVSQNVTINRKLGELAEGKTIADLPRLSEFVFVDGKTATIADGSYILSKAMTNTANNGSLVFVGDATFEAPNANAMDVIDINGAAAGKTVKYLSKINANGNLTFGANSSTLEFYGETLTANEIVGNAAGTPVLKFARVQGGQTFTAAAGANAAGIKMVFAGGDVTMAKDVASTEFEFANAAPITVTLNDKTLANAANFTLTSNALNKVSFATDQTFTGNLGDKALVLEASKVIVGAANQTVAVNSANSQYAQFTTTNTASKLAVGANTVALGSIGTADKPYATVTFDNDNALTVGDVYGKAITVNAGKQVVFKGAVNAETFDEARSITLTNAASTAEFAKNNIVLATKVDGAADDAGIVRFADINSTVAADLGTAHNLAKVSFLATSTAEVTKTSNLGADISATDIEFGKSTVVAQAGEVVLNGAVKFADSTVAVGKNTITANSIAFSGASTIETSFDGAKSGTLVNDKAGNLTFANGSTLDIVINDISGQIARDATTVTVLDNKGVAINDAARDEIVSKAKVTVKNNDLVNWVLSVSGTGTVKLTRESKASQVLVKDIKDQLGAGAKEEVAFIESVVAADRNSDAGKFADSLVKMDAKNRAEAAERIIASTQQGDESASNISAIGQRLGTFMSGSAAPAASVTPNARVASAEGVSGLAAGDEAERFGVWGMPFFGTATQNKHKGTPGYKSESAGGTLGFDTKVNDGLVVGAAFTYASSDIKHKDSKKGDKTKSEATMLSVYGLQQLTDSWFAQAVGTVGDNSVKTESIRVVANNKKEVAKGKYSSMSFAGQALVGYNYGLAGVEVTPMFGLGFTRVNDGSYKETGTANQNLDINKKASNKLEGILGAKLALANVNVGEALVTPEVHGFVYHNFNKKDQQVTVRMDGIKSSLPQKSNKSVKTTFNAGLGVTAKYGMMEYGAGYDAHMATKYLAHQGTLKVRVNF